MIIERQKEGETFLGGRSYRENNGGGGEPPSPQVAMPAWVKKMQSLQHRRVEKEERI